MIEKHKITDQEIKGSIEKYGFAQHTDEARLMLAELLLKSAAGYRNSYTEELFMNSFPLLKKDRTPNKKGRQFLCSMFYNHSNRKPIAFGLMNKYRLNDT